MTTTSPDVTGLLQGSPWMRFVGIGDSVVEGVREPAPGYRDLSWIDRLAAALKTSRPGLVHRNLGRRGLLAAEVRRQQLAPALAFRPDLAVVVAGGNDVFLRQFDADGVEAELTTMVAGLRSIGCDVITLGLFDITQADPAADGAEIVRQRIHALTELTARVAERHDAIHVDFTAHPAGTDPSIYSSDRLHPNARGHAIAAAGIVQRLDEVLTERGLR